MEQVALRPSDLRDRRRQARVTQEVLAKHLNVSVSAISDYENEKSELPWKLTAEHYEQALNALIARDASTPTAAKVGA